MDSCLHCPVTALKCCNEYLLTGQKSKLLIYSTRSGKLLLSHKLFERNSIHRFCEEKPGTYLVIGGKSVRRIRVVRELNELRIECLTDEKQFKGWIWDGMLITESKYVLISIHNTVVIWDCMTDERFPSSSCQEQCILYCARLQKYRNEVVVAAGTVFNQVLLWKPSLTEKHEYINTHKRFHGHEVTNEINSVGERENRYLLRNQRLI